MASSAVVPIAPSNAEIFWDENDSSVFVVVAHTPYRACAPMELDLKKENRIVVLDRTTRENVSGNTNIFLSPFILLNLSPLIKLMKHSRLKINLEHSGILA
jgi:hypothetical protein